MVGLSDISLELGAGQVTGVFGPSGAGKTTLLRIAAGLCRPDGGTVTYKGRSLDRMSAAELSRLRRQEVACAWTGPSWHERLGVLDHVALPLLIDGCSHRSAKRRARRALLACEAEQCIDMELGELSEGEHLRVAIARAVVSEPQMLLADGPTSSLSFIEADRIMELLSELAHKARVAVLVTARDAQALMRSDPILYLRDGELVAPEQLNEPGKLYRFPSAASHRAAADA